jgi:glycosyltransferase involved in cell wall biosynthesis
LYKTLAVLFKERPGVIFVQNPSLVLTGFAILYGKAFRKSVVVDAHNAGVYPFNGTRNWANRLAALFFRQASITIVTNSSLAEYVKRRGGNPIVLPDPIPALKLRGEKKPLKGEINVLYICSWASDEPYAEVIKAAGLIDPKHYIYMTGNSKGKANESKQALPGNIILTGYLSDEDFVQMLHSCDVIMDLTTRENCLVCGAYEAVAAGKPLIVSDTRALRNYFSEGVLFTRNTCEDIARQISNAATTKEVLSVQITSLKSRLECSWNRCKTELETALKSLTGT